jgi:hypothetical protein
LLISLARAQSSSGVTVPVTIDNFARAKSDLYMSNSVRGGWLGKLVRRREPASIDNHRVIRLNRATLYSSGMFDLNAGPVTITIPDPGKRFVSLQVINEDHYVPGVYCGAGEHPFTRQSIIGHDDTAIEHLHQAVANNPEFPKPEAHLAAMLSLNGKAAEACETLKRHLALPGTRSRTIAQWTALSWGDRPGYLALREKIYEGLRSAGMSEE